jgi:hypothetical protein
MKLLNQHERRLRRPLREVFADLAALGTAGDRIWPEPAMPFRRTAGPMQVGVTRERHGGIRAVLETYRENEQITWRVELPFLRGIHAFEVQQAGEGATLVRHEVRAELSWWFGIVWRLHVGRLHDRILEALLDRLEGVTP